MEIAREKLEKLLNPGNLTRRISLPKKECTYVRDCFQKMGLSRDKFYHRCGRVGPGSGFEEWEITGIYGCIELFCEERNLVCPTDAEKHRFYGTYCEGHREALWLFMQERGMGKNATIKRFRKWNFAEWELVGVRDVVEQIVGQDC